MLNYSVFICLWKQFYILHNATSFLVEHKNLRNILALHYSIIGQWQQNDLTQNVVVRGNLML